MRLVTLCVTMFFLLIAPPAYAQFDTATVVGSVHDSSAAVVAGAKVTLISADTGISTVKMSAENGGFEFPAVRPGIYAVTAEKSGFTPARVESVQVQVGARMRVDLQLPVG